MIKWVSPLVNAQLFSGLSAIYVDVITQWGQYVSFWQIGKNNEVRTKPIIWIEAGIHAREWVAPATAVYTIHKVIFTTYTCIMYSGWLLQHNIYSVHKVIITATIKYYNMYLIYNYYLIIINFAFIYNVQGDFQNLYFIHTNINTIFTKCILF